MCIDILSMKPHSVGELTSEELNVSVIRFLLLCICFVGISLVGMAPAKAMHTSHLQSVNLSTDDGSFEVSSLAPISLAQGESPTSKVPPLSVSNSHNLPSVILSHSLDVTSSSDLSHPIYVNGFSLRFSHGNFNSDELAPDYVKVFEFSEVSFASSARHYVERFTPQHQWMMHINSQSLRLSAWKDSNLQYIPQQYAHLFA
ncbi:hypothetical protein [Vibrio rumoiensis]|uniref:hypothetical protein n=1 Tax=Vibrio rumoiensis TaxID=76258 RepID=UPI003AA7D1E8